MRTIASTSGAHVTGITINEYQVSRAKHHNNMVRGKALLCFFVLHGCHCMHFCTSVLLAADLLYFQLFYHPDEVHLMEDGPLCL